MTSRRRPCTTLFPYTTLFRSQHRVARRLAECRLQVIREPASRGEQALAELRRRCPGSRISRSPWAAGPPQCEAESDERDDGEKRDPQPFHAVSRQRSVRPLPATAPTPLSTPPPVPW